MGLGLNVASSFVLIEFSITIFIFLADNVMDLLDNVDIQLSLDIDNKSADKKCNISV